MSKAAIERAIGWGFVEMNAMVRLAVLVLAAAALAGCVSTSEPRVSTGTSVSQHLAGAPMRLTDKQLFDFANALSANRRQCHALRRNVCLVTDEVPVAELAALADHAQRSVDNVSRFLNVAPPDLVPVLILKNTGEAHPVTRSVSYRHFRDNVLVSRESRSVVILPYNAARRIGMKISTTHEVAHAVASHHFWTEDSNNSWLLSEGLAVYLHTRFGDSANVPPLGRMPRWMSTANNFTGGYFAYLDQRNGKSGYGGPDATGMQKSFEYFLAGSFVGFLIERYGVEPFKQVYTGGSYRAVYGRSLNDLEKEWYYLVARS